MRDVRETIAHLLRLADRPGTSYEGIAAYQRAQVLCEKHGFNIEDFRISPRPRPSAPKPQQPPKPPTAPQPTPEPVQEPLHRIVSMFESVLFADGWRFMNQIGVVRIYESRYNPTQEMHIVSTPFGFRCNHVFKTGALRRQCPTPMELKRYLNTYEYMIDTTPFRPTGNVVVESLEREVRSGGYPA